MSRTTIYDIAAHAGTSVRTVGRFLREPDKLAPATRDRVAAAIAELGYRPNAYANRVSRGEYDVVAAVITATSSRTFYYWMRDMLCVASLALADAGKDLMVLAVDAENEDRVVRQHLRQSKFDGALVFGPVSARIAAELDGCEIPCVTASWDPLPAISRHAAIVFDAAAASRAQAEALVAHGYRRLLYVRPAGEAEAPRERGVRAVAGADFDVIEMTATASGAAVVIPEILARRPRPDVLVCVGDRMALSLLTQLQATGTRVPADIAVCGFGGMEALDYVAPALATVVVPHEEMARRAVARLLAFDPAAAGKVVSVPPTFSWGTSCGAPAAFALDSMPPVA
jgi:DNA-binding LacI/PurR family transcriptional regulator